MAWEAILSTDPRFEKIKFDSRQIERKFLSVAEEREDLDLLMFLCHMDPDIIFYNSENNRTHSVVLDHPIKPLSTVDSTDPNIIINLLESGCHSLPMPLSNVGTVPEAEVLISHQTMFVNDEKDADLHELL